MILSVLTAAVTIAFPREGAQFAYLERCYLIGATDGAETNLELRVVAPESRPARSVPVYRTGAWTAVVDVVPGTNVVEVGGCSRTFVVAEKEKGPPKPATVYTKLAYAADVAQPHPKGRKPSEIVIAVDAGHGGEDTGALSPHGFQEKDANLQLAMAVERELRVRGYQVAMTRTNDVTVGLYDRPKTGHASKAAAFVSIHHNAPGHSSDPAQCRYHAVYAWNEIGEKLAKAINGRMAAASPQLPSRGVIHANFAVTRNPEIPSCLVEADFVTHPDGEVASWDPARQKTVAAAIADGIVDWVAGK